MSLIRNAVTLEDIIPYFPNMAALHENTTFQVFKELNMNSQKVEITVLYQEPGDVRYRIDAVVTDFDIWGDAEMNHTNIKILSWRKYEGKS